MAELTVQNSDINGSELSFASADSDGDYFEYGLGNKILVVDNQDSSAHTVTLVAQKECKFGEKHDEEIEVPDGEMYFVTKIDERFEDENGEVQIDYDDVTSLEVAVLKY